MASASTAAVANPMLSVVNATNSNSFIQTFPLGYDVYYAGVTANRTDIAIFHQNPDFTLDSAPELLLSNASGSQIVPGSIRVSDQFSTAAGQMVAVTAMLQGSAQLTTWDVLYNSNEGTLSVTNQNTWAAAPQAGYTIASYAVSPVVAPDNDQSANPMWFPQKTLIDWASGSAHEGTMYTQISGRTQPKSAFFPGSSNGYGSISAVRLQAPNGPSSYAPVWGFAYLYQSKPAFYLVNSDGTQYSTTATVSTPGAKSILTASFASVPGAQQAATNGVEEFGVPVSSGSGYTMQFFQLVWNAAAQRDALQQIPDSNLPLKGITNVNNLSYGAVGVNGTATPMYLTVQDVDGQSQVVTADGTTGQPVANTSFVPALPADQRIAAGSSSVGNYLGGYAALGGVTATGQLGLYGYNGTLGGFDLSHSTEPATPLALPGS